MKQHYKILVAVPVAVLSVGTLWYLLFFNPPGLNWTMVNVNHGSRQGDAHIIQVKNGKTILIDTGYLEPAKEKLLPFLEENAITYFDYVFISHPHKDHYEGLRQLINEGIGINEIYFNLPAKELCDNEIPWGCDYQDLLNLQEELKKNKIPVKTAKGGQSFSLGDNTTITIIYAFDGIDTPIGRTGINDLSLIMMLQHKTNKMLFTGDLNWKVGKYIAQFPGKIEADILKVPHHGTESLAPDLFFQAVDPKIALVPAPAHIWLDKRSDRPRDWFKKHNIPVYVNGISGNIEIASTGSELKVTTEY